MSKRRIPAPALLVCSLLSACMSEVYEPVLKFLEERWGPVEFVSRDIPFLETGYYDRELGTPIVRRFLGFETLLPLDGLAEAKLWASEVEAQFTENGRRLVNVDPGLLTQERLVLASFKNFTHRIYQGQGVWADLTLIWQGGDWVILPWTYRDYVNEEMRSVLTELRERYRDKLNQRND